MTALMMSAALVLAGVDGSPWMAPLEVVTPRPAVRVETKQVGAAPMSPSAPSWSHCGEWYGLALDVGWPEHQWPTIDRVMFCESRCEPWAHHRSGASGLMQVMPGWWHGRDPYDPATNLAMALEVWQRQGWQAWSCF